MINEVHLTGQQINERLVELIIRWEVNRDGLGRGLIVLSESNCSGHGHCMRGGGTLRAVIIRFDSV